MSIDVEFNEFHSFTTKNYMIGHNFRQERRVFIAYHCLVEYWATQKIHALLQRLNINTVSAHEIRKDYLRLFSILIFIRRIDTLLSFVRTRVVDSALDCGDTNILPPHLAGDPDFKSKFQNALWIFFPVLFEPGSTSERQLSLGKILPFCSIKKHNHDSRDATFQVAEIEETTHAHLPKKDQIPRRLFLKTFTREHEEQYKAEMRAYRNLREANENIVKLVGSYSFSHGGGHQSSTLVFEHSDIGSLYKHFTQSSPPYTAQGIRVFWKSFEGFLKGIETIHGKANFSSECGLHGDLKPSNIILFPGNPPTLRHSFAFKIADFGHSCQVGAPNGEDSINTPHPRGSKTYGPPELCLSDEIKYDLNLAADMWSTGCVILETAAWVIGGPIGIDDFKADRMQETSKFKDFQDCGLADCFHDGHGVLQSVSRFAKTLKKSARLEDDITPKMIDLALENLLVSSHRRREVGPSAVLAQMWKINPLTEAAPPAEHQTISQQRNLSTIHSFPTPSDIYQGSSSTIPQGYPPAGNELDLPKSPQPPSQRGAMDSINHSHPRSAVSQNSMAESYRASTATTTQGRRLASNGVGYPQSSQSLRHGPLDNHFIPYGPTIPQSPLPDIRRSSTSPFPKVTMAELRSWREGGGKGKLEGLNEAEPYIMDRDFIILLDNSRPMQPHREKVENVIHNLAYLMKIYDTNGIEFRCTSNARKKQTFTTSTKAKELVRMAFAENSQVDCDMHRALTEAVPNHLLQSPTNNGIFSPRIKKRLRSNSILRPRPTSILVFTCGVWSESSDPVCQVDQPIESIIKEMKARGLAKTDFSIQFVRFGDDANGIRRLNYLDDELAKKPENRGYDIVDHKPEHDGIWQLLIGPLLEGIDMS